MTSATVLFQRLADLLQQQQQAAPATGQTTKFLDVRTRIRQSWPSVRKWLGVAFVAGSAGTTVFGFNEDIAPLTQRLITDQIVPDGWPALAFGLVLGLAVALAIFFGQIYTAEHEQWIWYGLLLIIDTRYTYRLFDYIISAFNSPIAAEVLGWIAAALVAHFGERWLFGKRRAGWLKRLFTLQWGRV